MYALTSIAYSDITSGERDKFERFDFFIKVGESQNSQNKVKNKKGGKEWRLLAFSEI